MVCKVYINKVYICIFMSIKEAVRLLTVHQIGIKYNNT
jgi:hypothetical protein